MEAFKMKLPFLKKYRHVKLNEDGYKIFDRDGNEIGSFTLQQEHKIYFAEGMQDKC